MNIGSLNLLVVDDDAFQRKMAVSSLRAVGATSIEEAENGRLALELVQRSRQKPIDIVICDLQMPEMDGLEFLRLLGQQQHNVAIVIVSALQSKLLLSTGKMAKMHGIKLLGVIEKPIRVEQLKGLLDQYERTEKRWHQSGSTARFTLEDVLQAIREKQLEPFFQPKVDMQTGHIVGAEALARWIHPEHGMISPLDFIPILEQNGEIDELVFLMLEKTEETSRSFFEHGCQLSISVNLSQSSLAEPTLADRITNAVQQSGIEPQHIILEITETAAMTDVASALENLTRLVMKGFVLSIDDYGTGYSSLQQLSRIVFGELKIDQSFIQGITEDETARIIVESSIDMARKLNVKSVAEGVETQQQWEMLKQMGCDVAQGYFIGKPMDRDSFFQFYEQHSPLGQD